jgi:glycerophosphoryl diester phosphodiesterase
VLVAAAVVVVLLAAGLFVLKPWEGSRATSSGTPGPVPSSGAGSPATASGSASPTSSGAPGGTPQVLAHRGGLEVHQFETEQAMEAAAAAGFWVETDVRFTSDGVAVLVHDEKATKGLDCGGRSIKVSETTWADLDRYCRSKPTARDPNQYRVPRLAPTLEGIAAASGDVQVFLEVKTDQTDAERDAFLAAPAEFGLRDRTVITSARREWLDAIASADPTYRRMLFVSGTQVPADDLAGDGLWAVAVEQGVATQKYVDELHAIGVRVVIWVLNDPAQWAKFVPYGPDIVMTAYPARFTQWLAGR